MLQSCRDCKRHYAQAEAQCPFCGASAPAPGDAPPKGRVNLVVLGGTVLAAAVSACMVYGAPAVPVYGAPAPSPTPSPGQK